ncbi:MAG: 1-deoxy-D-xylulose-5-phosphate synthase [Chloroflexota bacterium]|nr:1-deoxy-D-xylulose-5-phosphate synthase [Chloroflexota bacterium]
MASGTVPGREPAPATIPAQGIPTPILDRIAGPADLKSLALAELHALADDVRTELIRVVSRNGGHLGASLGTVELAIALHTVFDSPRDRIVWDVGHQAYTHKLLTGRRARFETVRQENGLSGFLSRDESEHDAFGAGHASTSISAALGMAAAFRQTGQPDRRVVAVIGDGALTGGMAFEALNNAGILNLPFLVVLNDNEMSIAPNVGALSRYLDRMRTDRLYNRAKDELARFTERLPQGELLVELGKRWKDSVKEFVYHAQIWEELGFTYVGPVDGNDLRATIEALRQARNVEGPVFLHLVTQKGKGVVAFQTDHERGHAVSAPAIPGAPAAPPKYQDVFARTVIELANDDPRVVAITAAMPGGTSLGKFQAAHPDRFYDVGIAEQHAVTFAAGLAAEGLRPVVGIYSTFLQRAYDQIVHDVCIQRLPVIFAMDRAGFAGDDGRTHHGVYDLSYLRCLPNMTIMAPKDENELRHMLKTAVEHTAGPCAVRYPRGTGAGVATDEPLHALPIGRAEVLRDGTDVAILAVGAMVLPAERAADRLAADGIAAAVINARFVKPLDARLILDLAARCRAIVTVEESAAAGGFGAGVLELLAAHQVSTPVRVLGVPDRVFDHASQGRLREQAGLTPADIAAAARSLLAPAADRPNGTPVFASTVAVG